MTGMYHSVEKYKETTNQITENFTSNTMEIIINSGEKYGEQEIAVGIKKDEIVTVLCNNDQVNYKILSGNNLNETKIIFFYYTDVEQVSQYEVNFTYTIVRRISN